MCNIAVHNERTSCDRDHTPTTPGASAPLTLYGKVCHIKNYWRDRKSDLPLGEGPDVILEEKEKVESSKRTVEQRSRLLLPEELAFMKMLGQVVDEPGDRTPARPRAAMYEASSTTEPGMFFKIAGAMVREDAFDMFSLPYFTSTILCTLVNVFPDEPVATRRQINMPELT
jgi:hypothetical protein